MFVKVLDVGQGDSTFLRLPNGTSILVDCCVNDKIISWLNDNLPEDDDGKKILDYLIITHPHEDHIRGIKKLGDNYKINNFYESGHRLYVSNDKKDEYQQYYDMLALIQKVKKNGGEHVKLEAYAPLEIIDEPEVQITVLSPTEAYLLEEKTKDRDIHDQCLVLRVEYKNRVIMFTGDSSLEAWRDRIHPKYEDKKVLKSTILHASHHGSYTFFKPKGKGDEDANTDIIDVINPDMTIISVGKDNNHGHPDDDALSIYTEVTNDKQLFRTDEHGSIELTFEEDGDFRVFTEKMKRNMRKPTVGKVVIDTNISPDDDGFYPIGTKLEFSAKIKKKPKGQSIKFITWTVQNNSTGEHDIHHEYYIGQSKKEFKYTNDTAYSGSHTLLCEVYNQRSNLLAVNSIVVKVK